MPENFESILDESWPDKWDIWKAEKKWIDVFVLKLIQRKKEEVGTSIWFLQRVKIGIAALTDTDKVIKESQIELAWSVNYRTIQIIQDIERKDYTWNIVEDKELFSPAEVKRKRVPISAEWWTITTPFSDALEKITQEVNGKFSEDICPIDSILAVYPNVWMLHDLIDASKWNSGVSIETNKSNQYVIVYSKPKKWTNTLSDILCIWVLPSKYSINLALQRIKQLRIPLWNQAQKSVLALKKLSR